MLCTVDFYHGSSTPQNSSCTTIYLPSCKPVKKCEQDIQDTVGEVINIFLRTPIHRNNSVGQPEKNLHSSALCGHWVLSRGWPIGIVDKRESK